MPVHETVAVFGAYGHTGRFVVAELCRRGFAPILAGRDGERLAALAARHGGLETRTAAVDDPGSLDRALAGAAVVINCAGPFAVTAAPVVEAALRARIPALDVAAEVEVAAATFERFAGPAREAGVVVVPAMGFFGGLGDLLATAALAGDTAADEISLAYALDSWRPTAGTRRTIETSTRRRGGQRLVYSDQRLELRTGAAPVGQWVFPPPFGSQRVLTEFLTADSVTIPRHLRTAALHTCMTLAPLADLGEPEGPTAADASGRSAQTFVVEVLARVGGAERRAVASGRDIYAVTGPLVVEATVRVLARHAGPGGVFAGGEIFDAPDFLRSLAPQPLDVALPAS